MVMGAYQVDAKVSITCAVLAISHDDAKERIEAELHRLLTCAQPQNLYLDIKEIEINATDIKQT